MDSFSTRFYFTTSKITKLVVRNLSGVDYTFTQSGVAQQIEGTAGDILTVTATVIDGYKIKSVVNGTVVDKTHFTIPLGTEVFSVNSAEDLPQLSTPTNVAVTDTTLTFDEVANATSYEVFVDNVSIGTYEVSQEQWDTPTIQLNNNELSTPIVEGVTMYKVYSNGSYIGYIDANNTWHGEVSE